MNYLKSCNKPRAWRDDVFVRCQLSYIKTKECDYSVPGSNCLEDATGMSYRGNHNITESGNACIAWWTVLSLPGQPPNATIIDAQNFCRNVAIWEAPFDMTQMPACLIGPESNDYEYCDIPRCSDTMTTQVPSTVVTSQTTSASTTFATSHSTSAPSIVPTSHSTSTPSIVATSYSTSASTSLATSHTANSSTTVAISHTTGKLFAKKYTDNWELSVGVTASNHIRYSNPSALGDWLLTPYVGNYHHCWHIHIIQQTSGVSVLDGRDAR